MPCDRLFFLEESCPLRPSQDRRRAHVRLLLVSRIQGARLAVMSCGSAHEGIGVGRNRRLADSRRGGFTFLRRSGAPCTRGTHLLGMRAGRHPSFTMDDERAAVRRWLAGQRASTRMQRTLQAAEGPRPARAVVQSLSALSALETMGRWPSPRDVVSERAIEEVRRRWVRIQQRARGARS